MTTGGSTVEKYSRNMDIVKRLTTIDSARKPMATIARVWAEANDTGGSWESPVASGMFWASNMSRPPCRFLMALASIRRKPHDIREKAQAVLISVLKSWTRWPLNWLVGAWGCSDRAADRLPWRQH